MITSSITHWCPTCHSTNIVGNGHTTYGAQRCLCPDCGRTRLLVPRRQESITAFAVAALVLHLLPLREAKDRFVISIDRTEWHCGKTPINIFMASLLYQGTAFPLV